MAKYQSARIGLNLNKPGKYGMYDPVSGLDIDRGKPIGVIYRLSPSIIVGLRGKIPTLIDLDNVIDIEKGCFKDISENEEIIVPQPPAQNYDASMIVNFVNEEVHEDVVEEVKDEVVEEVIEEVKVEEQPKPNKKKR